MEYNDRRVNSNHSSQARNQNSLTDNVNEDKNAGTGQTGSIANNSRTHYRPHINIKPRSISIGSDVPTSFPSTPASFKKKQSANPFGAAKPREEVLASKGIDFHTIDERIEKKATVEHFSRVQELRLDQLQAELSEAEVNWRERNERELPEGNFLLQMEDKRKRLERAMREFRKENEKKESLKQYEKTEGQSHTWQSRRNHHPHQSRDDGGSTRYHRSTDNDEEIFASFDRSYRRSL